MVKGWEAIRAEVLHRIRVRIWPPGGLIPPEEVLAQEFGCARATVNRALSELTGAGVLERKRRAGTRVALLPVRKATLQIAVIRQEIEARGQIHRFRLLEARDEEPPLAVLSRLGLVAGHRLRWLETLHLADDRPFLLEHRWLNLDAVPKPPADFASVSVNEWLVAHVPYTSGDIAFSAEAANAREAEVLGVAPGTPLFITERSTHGPVMPITLVRLAHAPGYRMQTRV